MEIVMLEQYFVKPSTIDRIRASCLAPQIENYVEWMEMRGYGPGNIIRRVPLLCHFADFAQKNGCIDLASAAASVEGFVSHWVALHETGATTEIARNRFQYDAGNPVRQMMRLACDG